MHYEICSELIKSNLENLRDLINRLELHNSIIGGFFSVIAAIMGSYLTDVDDVSFLDKVVVSSLISLIVIIIFYVIKRISINISFSWDKYAGDGDVYKISFYEDYFIQTINTEFKNKKAYSAIRYIYEDNECYYIVVDVYNAFILKKTDYTIGQSRDFHEFISNKSKKIIRCY